MKTARPLKDTSAYKCERATKGEQCQCRCKGKFHGARRKTVPRDDPHAAAFYCPCCGSSAPLHHRSELRFENPKSLAKLRALDPWRNIGKTLARPLPNKEELLKLSREQLLKLLLEEVAGIT
jgi:hypothetical protein